MIRKRHDLPRPSERLARRAFMAAALSPFLALPLPVPAGATGETPKTFIASLGDTAIRELSPDGTTAAQRDERFRVLFRENFDVERIARFTLGRYARRISKEELAVFTALYEDLAVLTYADLFAEYAGFGFKVTKQLGSAGDKYVMVVSQVTQQDGAPPTQLDWQVLVRSSGFSVVDIRVEGVSMAIAQRDEYTSVLDKNKGDMTVLLKVLEAKVKVLRAERKAQ